MSNIRRPDTIYLMFNYDNFYRDQQERRHMVCIGQVFPGAGVFISDTNILIPFTSDYIEDID